MVAAEEGSLEKVDLWDRAYHMPLCTAVQTSPAPHRERTDHAHVPGGS